MAKPTPATDLLQSSEFTKLFYETDPQSWYLVFPFVFSIENLETTDKDKKYLVRYALPIPPESLVMQVIAPSEAMPTLNGVVEENSAITFWNLQMTGTMGIAPSRNKADGTQTPLFEMAKNFRGVIEKTGLISGLVNGFADNLAKLSTIGGALTGNDASFVDGLSALIQPKLPYTESGVNGTSNGYTEIHNLHKLFILYGKLNSRKERANPGLPDKGFDNVLNMTKDQSYGLFFYNYKDNQKFRVILKNFSIIKSVQQPYLPKYQITLKAWDLQEPEAKAAAVDRFGKDGDLKTVNTMSVTSAINAAKNLLRTFNSARVDPIGTFTNISSVG